MSASVMCHKVTLNTKKIVLLRDPKIKDQELAGQLSGANTDNVLSTSMLFQKEMIKILLLEVDGKKLSAIQKEDLDALFTLREYAELTFVIKQLMGDSAAGKPLMELVPVGGPSLG